MSTATASTVTETVLPAPKARKSRYQTYASVLSQTDKPLARRRELPIGRNGSMKKPTKYHLNDDEIAELKAQYKETKRFPNPHNKGLYYYTVEALVELGINEKHTQTSVMKRVEKMMSDPETIRGEGKDATTAWERWKNKEPRNKETGKDWEARFDQNITVLQRVEGNGVTPYGLKIMNVGQKVMGKKGAVIDILVAETGTRYLRLNTNSDSPINESKIRGKGSPAAIKAERAERRAAKAAVKPRKEKAVVPAVEVEVESAAAAAAAPAATEEVTA